MVSPSILSAMAWTSARVAGSETVVPICATLVSKGHMVPDPVETLAERQRLLTRRQGLLEERRRLLRESRHLLKRGGVPRCRQGLSGDFQPLLINMRLLLANSDRIWAAFPDRFL